MSAGAGEQLIADVCAADTPATPPRKAASFRALYARRDFVRIDELRGATVRRELVEYREFDPEHIRDL